MTSQPSHFPHSTRRAVPISSRMTCYFSGRVQGVGFRYTVKNIAMQYNVHGYVRNLSDGRVELVMEGSQAEMDRLLDEVCQKMNGYISHVDSSTLPATGEFEHFYIRH
jgi:acylphosphatase